MKRTTVSVSATDTAGLIALLRETADRIEGGDTNACADYMEGAYDYRVEDIVPDFDPDDDELL